jgi:hypothetical protein
MVSKSLQKDNKVSSSGLNNFTHVPTVEQNQAPMFSFGIKPAEQRRQSESKHQFKFKSDEVDHQVPVTNHTNHTNQTVNLIDFGSSEVSVRSENNKVNTIDLLGGVDFNNSQNSGNFGFNNGVSVTNKPQNDMFGFLPTNT